MYVLLTNNQTFLKEFHTTETTYTKYTMWQEEVGERMKETTFVHLKKVSGYEAKMVKRERSSFRKAKLRVKYKNA